MRIWLHKKVYDLETMPTEDIEKDIEAELLDYFKTKMGVSVKKDGDKAVEVLIHRTMNVEAHDDTILEQDTWLLTGEGHQNFVPAYSAAGSFAHFADITYYIDKGDFETAYKRNAEFYGGSKIKKVAVTEWTTMLVLRIEFA